MAVDLILAILHHILVFGLVAMLAAETVLLRPGITVAEVGRIARLDAGYGGTAGGIVVVGVLRVVYGAKGADYYLGNPWFWAKMASFVAVGVLSIVPTMQFIAWRRRLVLDPSYLPSTDDVEPVRRLLRWEGLLVLLVIGFAATMARTF
jgi:putative membrane protein